MEFSYDKYKEILLDFKLNKYNFVSFLNADKLENEKYVYLRHDVDMNLKKSLDLARIEHELGVTSTWYVMPNNKLYNLMDKESIEIINELSQMGHTVGLHIDASGYDTKEELEKDIIDMYEFYSKYMPISKTISFHVPNEKILDSDIKIDGFINAYEDRFYNGLTYVSDSNRRPFLEQERYFDGFINKKNFQLLIHPMWWNESDLKKDQLHNHNKVNQIETLRLVEEECKWDENPYKKDNKIVGVSSVENPKDNTLIFCNEKFYNRYKNNLNKVKNCLILLPKTLMEESINIENNKVRFVDNPRVTFGKILEEQQKNQEERYIDEKSFIDKNSYIGQNPLIEENVIIEKDVELGDNVTIKSGSKVLKGTKIGNNCYIGNNTVLGADGLAFEFDEEENYYQKIPQLGNVVIEDNVNIGANSVVARGAIVDTKIGNGSKIDNNCFISHNVKMGKNCIMVGNSILMGSVELGDRVYISGGVTVRDNITLGDNAFVGMGSVVINSIEHDEMVIGNPAKKKLKKLL